MDLLSRKKLCSKVTFKRLDDKERDFLSVLAKEHDINPSARNYIDLITDAIMVTEKSPYESLLCDENIEIEMTDLAKAHNIDLSTSPIIDLTSGASVQFVPRPVPESKFGMISVELYDKNPKVLSGMDFQPVGLVKDHEIDSTLWVAPKLDGVAGKLSIIKNSARLTNRAGAYRTFQCATSLEYTIFDCEYTNTAITLVDAVFVDGLDFRDRPFRDRFAKLRNLVLTEILPRGGGTGATMYTNIQDFSPIMDISKGKIVQKLNRPFIDGLIFSDPEATYHQIGAVRAWKNYENLSIDVRVLSTYNRTAVCVVSHQNVDVEYVRIPSPPKFVRKFQIWELRLGPRGWNFFRCRLDKKTPNTWTTVNEVVRQQKRKETDTGIMSIISAYSTNFIPPTSAELMRMSPSDVLTMSKLYTADALFNNEKLPIHGNIRSVVNSTALAASALASMTKDGQCFDRDRPSYCFPILPVVETPDDFDEYGADEIVEKLS